MKKIIYFLMIFLYGFMILTFSVSGEENNLNLNEATNLIEKAFFYHKSLTENYVFYADSDDRITHDGTDYVLVKEEYSKENISNSLRNIFAEQCYDATIDRYLHGYQVKDDKSYFIAGFVAQFTRYYTDDIEVRLLTSDNKEALAEVKIKLGKEYFHSIGNEKKSIYVFFSNTNDGWRIDGADYKDAIFCVSNTVKNTEALTNDWLCDMVYATVYDLLTYTRISSYQLRCELEYIETYPGITETVVWQNYAREFCSDYVIEKIFNNSTEIEFTKDKISLIGNFDSIPDFLSEIPSREVVKRNLEITHLEGDNALVIFEVPGSDISINYELQKTTAGWRVTGGSYMQILDDVSLINNPNTIDENQVIKHIFVLFMCYSLIFFKKRTFCRENG